MPATDFAKILGTVFHKAEEKSLEEKKKFEKSRDEDIEMYRGVLLNPDSSDEQRQKAADQISKLRNIKGKDSPFHKIAGILNHIKGKSQDSQGQSQSSQGSKPLQGEVSGVPRQMSPLTKPSNVGRQLPPIDSGVIPTAEQTRANKVADLKASEEAKWPYEEKKIRLMEELRTKTAADKARNAMMQKERYTGQEMISALPQQMQTGLLDANGIPVDPNGTYGPAAGEHVGIAYDAEGRPMLNGIRVGTGAARERTSEQIVYNPQTGQFETFQVRSTSKPPNPPSLPKLAQPALKGRETSGQGKPTPKAGDKPISQLGATAGHSKGRSLGNLVPIRQFGPLQKQSNAINEARNSLIGDNPSQVGGMAGDIEIFKNPESVKRVSQYVKFINNQLESESKLATGAGPMAALEWYAGLPAAVSNLQSDQLREYSASLDGGAPDGPEHKFIADYYRLLGTWGGMRAATGASAARWSFRNLISEIPTPGPVTSYPEAVRRIENMANESNVVAKTNPMVGKIDTSGIFKKQSKQNKSDDPRNWKNPF